MYRLGNEPDNFLEVLIPSERGGVDPKMYFSYSRKLDQLRVMNLGNRNIIVQEFSNSERLGIQNFSILERVAPNQIEVPRPRNILFDKGTTIPEFSVYQNFKIGSTIEVFSDRHIDSTWSDEVSYTLYGKMNNIWITSDTEIVERLEFKNKANSILTFIAEPNKDFRMIIITRDNGENAEVSDCDLISKK